MKRKDRRETKGDEGDEKERKEIGKKKNELVKIKKNKNKNKNKETYLNPIEIETTLKKKD